MDLRKGKTCQSCADTILDLEHEVNVFFHAFYTAQGNYDITKTSKHLVHKFSNAPKARKTLTCTREIRPRDKHQNERQPFVKPAGGEKWPGESRFVGGPASSHDDISEVDGRTVTAYFVEPDQLSKKDVVAILGGVLTWLWRYLAQKLTQLKNKIIEWSKGHPFMAAFVVLAASLLAPESDLAALEALDGSEVMESIVAYLGEWATKAWNAITRMLMLAQKLSKASRASDFLLATAAGLLELFQGEPISRGEGSEYADLEQGLSALDHLQEPPQMDLEMLSDFEERIDARADFSAQDDSLDSALHNLLDTFDAMTWLSGKLQQNDPGDNLPKLGIQDLAKEIKPQAFQTDSGGLLKGFYWCALATLSDRSIIPGKSDGQQCFYSYGGWEYDYDDPASCKLVFGRRSSARGVALGYQTDRGGDADGRYWVAVAKNTPWGEVPGKADKTTCWYSYGGREHQTMDFDYVNPIE